MDIQGMIKSDKEKLKSQLQFSPEVFKAAVPQAGQCEHLRAAAWENNYASGVKCVKCGKELSAFHQEESQLLGVRFWDRSLDG
jgi:Zn ribbon nucleic-acid-binding protein